MNRTHFGRWICAGAALLIAADQLSKGWALDVLGAEGVSRPLAGWLSATLVFNRSNAFGVVPVAGEVSRWGLVALNLVVAAALAWLLWRRPLRAATTLGLGFMIAGAVGNAIDRIRLGFVVDFLDVSRLGFPWIFNLADASLDAGIALLVLSVFLARERNSPPIAQGAADEPS